MNAENFIKFNKYFEAFLWARKNKPGWVMSVQESPTKFEENILKGLDSARVFEVSDDTKKLLCLTDPPNKNDPVMLPFEHIFLDVSFTKEELKNYGIEINANQITGIMAQKGHFLDKDTGEMFGENIRLSMFSVQEDDSGWFDTFNKNFNFDDPDTNPLVVENPTTDKKAREFCHKFFLNFINFLNNPEVEYIEHRRSEGNIKRRLKRGKAVIPSTMTIRVYGRLKQYIDEIGTSGKIHYNYRFWVRGHFRELQSDRYKEKKRIWILPYIKGEGILIEKTYKVQRKK